MQKRCENAKRDDFELRMACKVPVGSSECTTKFWLEQLQKPCSIGIDLKKIIQFHHIDSLAINNKMIKVLKFFFFLVLKFALAKLLTTANVCLKKYKE